MVFEDRRLDATAEGENSNRGRGAQGMLKELPPGSEKQYRESKAERLDLSLEIQSLESHSKKFGVYEEGNNII